MDFDIQKEKSSRNLLVALKRTVSPYFFGQVVGSNGISMVMESWSDQFSK